MLNEIVDCDEVTYTQIDKILACLESLIAESKHFHLNVNVYQLFLKEKEINESETFKIDKTQYVKIRL